METFHGFDFDTMTEISAEADGAGVTLDGHDGDDVSFMRGLMFGFLFAVPGWLLLAAIIGALT